MGRKWSYGKIHGCYANDRSAMRIVDSAETCAGGESPTGPSGAAMYDAMGRTLAGIYGKLKREEKADQGRLGSQIRRIGKQIAKLKARARKLKKAAATVRRLVDCPTCR